jgi:EAL domain-containing protein (putative c-di-GMP-specific phosphodiesterase class I)
MKVVAEGVENEEQFRLLKRLKCDLAQGYLFSRPIDSESVDAMLLAGRRGEVLGPGGTVAA